MYEFKQLPERARVTAVGLLKIIAVCAAQPKLLFRDFWSETLGRPNGTSAELAYKRTFVFNPRGLKLDADRGRINAPPVPAAVVAVDEDFYIVAEGALEPDDLELVRSDVFELFR